ncbi:hypothetical protein FRC07_005141 [Ceratobasidium sp. 392]|nr:hypothetical protein FRC07_005141 [Ceratobasidium sp. 392]
MPHLRLNAKTDSPNPYFNFISALPSFLKAPDFTSEQNAKELLNALAAQVRPICKKHGFTVNSFEEYEHNKVFLGRNWNAGETIEIVLRRSDGTFHDIQQLIQVLCHELSHIKHMNHGTGFQQLNAQICHEVAILRSKGYYGDGMYSSGSRLSDSAEVAGRGLGATDYDLPEYMCGGAQQRQRASTIRRIPRRNAPHATTTKRRKAGTRVTSKYAFKGEGQALNAHITSESEKKAGTGFRKSAQSAKERQARLEATEKRLRALQQSSTTEPTSSATLDEDSDEDSDSLEETDESRRKLLSDTGIGWRFGSTLDTKEDAAWENDDILDLISDNEASESRAAISNVPTPSTKANDVGLGSSGKAEKQTHGLANMVRSEIEYRKRERLGLVGGRRLGGTNPVTSKSRLLGSDSPVRPTDCGKQLPEKEASTGNEDAHSNEWACLVCTWCVHVTANQTFLITTTTAFAKPVLPEEGRAVLRLDAPKKNSLDCRTYDLNGLHFLFAEQPHFSGAKIGAEEAHFRAEAV